MFQFDLVNHEITYDIFIKSHRLPVSPLNEKAGGNAPVTYPLSGTPGFNLLEYVKRFKC